MRISGLEIHATPEWKSEPIGTALVIRPAPGTTGLNMATRIMGLLLAAIGIQMLAAGLVKLLPGLA